MSIVRFQRDEKQTLGKGLILDKALDPLFEFCTLELPWENNEQRVSCIPAGTYKVVKRYSRKYKRHLHITNVPGRSYILIHPGNYHSQILGCILPGSEHADINQDGHMDVIQSRQTMERIMDLVPAHFTLQIIDEL